VKASALDQLWKAAAPISSQSWWRGLVQSKGEAGKQASTPKRTWKLFLVESKGKEGPGQ
jgi:hypothetical protein